MASQLTSCDRRAFVKASLTPAAVSLAAALARQQASLAAPAPAAAPEIVDTNVHLFEWPFRKLKYAETTRLVQKLRKHRITRAWAGSFEAVLHKRLDAVNLRLAEECRRHGEGLLVAAGSVNPAGPDWQEDLRRCHEQYRMRIVRLYPAYHGYPLEHPELARLLAEATNRQLVVQIVLRLEDERVHHPALDLPPVPVGPLVEVLKKTPQAKVQLLNAAGASLGTQLAALIRDTQVAFDISHVEQNGGVGKLLEGKNQPYRAAIPIDRLLFGSHAPFFPCENAVLKLLESPLSLEQLEKLMNASARRWLV